MSEYRICTVISVNDPGLVKNVSGLTDLFELRLDLVGDGWEKLIPVLDKPWIAACRPKSEGGTWLAGEEKRIRKLLAALEAGADMIDLELSTPGIEDIVPEVKKKAKLIVSFHDFNRTPGLTSLKTLVGRQFECGADIAKVATAAADTRANLRLLEIVALYKGSAVAIGMGHKGLLSRIMCPVYGGAFTYASLAAGLESAPGQLTAFELRHIYRLFES